MWSRQRVWGWHVFGEISVDGGLQVGNRAEEAAEDAQQARRSRRQPRKKRPWNDPALLPIEEALTAIT